MNKVFLKKTTTTTFRGNYSPCLLTPQSAKAKNYNSDINMNYYHFLQMQRQIKKIMKIAKKISNIRTELPAPLEIVHTNTKQSFALLLKQQIHSKTN